MKQLTINKEKKPTKLIITEGGYTIILFNRVITLFAKKITEEQVKNLLIK